jgi:hypothetical protein
VSGEAFVYRACFLHLLRSRLACALPSAIVCHCMLYGASAPPQASGTLYSTTYPDRPLGYPVSTSNVCLAARLRAKQGAEHKSHRIRTFLMLFPSCQANWRNTSDSRGLLNGNHNLASLTVGERHRTHLRKMMLLTDLPMLSSLKWRRFQTGRANINRSSKCCVIFIVTASPLYRSESPRPPVALLIETRSAHP